MNKKYIFYLGILSLVFILIILWAVFIIDTMDQNQKIDYSYYHPSSFENKEPKYILGRYHPVETYTSPYDNRDYVNQIYKLYPQYYYP